jgi:signal transduction histidine kinase
MRRPEILKNLLEDGDFDIMVKAYPTIAIVGSTGYLLFYFTDKALGLYENIVFRIFIASIFLFPFFIRNKVSVFQKIGIEAIFALSLPLFYSYFYFATDLSANWSLGFIFCGFAYGILTGKIFNTVTLYPFAVCLGFLLYSMVFRNTSMINFFQAANLLIATMIIAIVSSFLKLIFNYHLYVLINQHKEQTTFEEQTKFTLFLEETGQLEQKLSLMYRLEKVAKFVRDISSDFNNMLSVIMLQSSLLKKNYTDPVKIKKITTMLDTAEKASHLFNNIVVFAQDHNFNRDTVDIHLLIDKVIDLLDKDSYKNICINKQLLAKKVIVEASEILIQNAILNIVINAKQAMPDGGALTIDTADYNKNVIGTYLFKNYIRIRISDTGTGIDDSIINNIFELFFTTKEIGKGSGMGLSMVYGIVKKHGGNISVESKKDQGSTFTIDLPTVDSVFKTKFETAIDMENQNGRIFIYDMDDRVADSITEMLTFHKYEVNRLHSYKDLVDSIYLHSNSIDMIIADLSGINGDLEEMLLYPLEKYTNISFVIMGNSNNGKIKSLNNYGNLIFINKPLNEKMLLQTINKNLKRQ